MVRTRDARLKKNRLIVSFALATVPLTKVAFPIASVQPPLVAVVVLDGRRRRVGQLLYYVSIAGFLLSLSA